MLSQPYGSSFYHQPTFPFLIKLYKKHNTETLNFIYAQSIK